MQRKKYRPWVYRLRLLMLLAGAFVLIRFVFPAMGVYAYFIDRGHYPPLSAADASKPCRDLDQLTPMTKKLCEAFLARCAEEGLPVKITETYRPQDRQDVLYEQGRTAPGAVVTWTKRSKHTTRRAFDICKNVPGQEFSDDDFFRRCAEIGRSLGLEAGYFWTDHPDKPHFELRRWYLPR